MDSNEVFEFPRNTTIEDLVSAIIKHEKEFGVSFKGIEFPEIRKGKILCDILFTTNIIEED